MKIDIPDYKELDLKYLVLDYNGTIAVDGEISESIKERLRILSEQLEIYVLTADTHGTAKEKCEGLPLVIKTFPDQNALKGKEDIVQELGLDACVAIGNGRNDRLMLRDSRLSIAVIAEEGMCSALLRESDVFARSMEEALDLLIHPKRLVATLRGN